MSLNQQETAPTSEQAAATREDLVKFYDEYIPVLQKQLEYETLKTKIATEQAKHKQAVVAMAQMGAPEKLPKVDQDRVEKTS